MSVIRPKIGSPILTLTWLEVTQLNLLLLVRQLGRALAEQCVQPALVGRVGHDDQDGEEEEREDGLPQLHTVLKDKKLA